ncbi:FUSC family protein [Gluconacetobacter diazotrophicus]|uniref:Fusaric acid resistance protein conserved region n=1 Tax=Gluconacetobacter diazotrophicus (strain ATCC 49037 / DSM 5601 / CCUG 37298 / CIP 103539 / LMG 7603 / PAl5) TaxID=272568 RepID=A9H9G0_GLUDA|nr:FUSC family protein [Gluconacetobacter diazotrophicus]CAP57703.1 conserved hypothetical protein [Gluconacetobacter diazotrophicus PA1 5]
MTGPVRSAPVWPRLVPAVFTDSVRWRDMGGRAAFCARVFASIGLALYCAFTFQLESPMSSVTTVMIVANPTVGALMSKSVWRIIGTVLGAAVSVALMAGLAQSPVLYVMVLAVAVAFACLVATFLRLFRAYAAVLSGYTIVIVAAPSYADPNGIFLSAMSRLSAVTVGIVATAIVFMATSPRRPQQVLTQIGQVMRDVVAHALAFHEFHQGAPVRDQAVAEPGLSGFRAMPVPLYDSRGALLARIGGLGAAVEYAATDTYEIARRVNALRVGLSGLAGIVATYHPLWRGMDGDAPDLRRLHGRIAALMTELLDLMARPGWVDDPAPVRARIGAALDRLAADERAAAATDGTALLAAMDTVRDILAQLDTVMGILTGDAVPRRVRLRWFLDWPSALRNGARGGIITLLAGLIWYVLHWHSGPMLMLYIVAASSLISTTPSASRASVLMAAGTALSVPAGVACHMLALPRIDGFPLLWLVLCAFVLPGAWIQFSPRWGIGAFGYSVFFAAQLDVSNPIRYDDIALTNTWMAFLMASALLVLGFRVILPPDDRLDAARLAASITRSLRRLALVLPDGPGTWVAWEGLQVQKTTRMVQRLALCMPPAERQARIDAALASVSLGRLVIRARRIADGPALAARDRAALHAALGGFARLRRDPDGTARGLEGAADAMRAGADTGTDAGLAAWRVAACLDQAAHILRAVPGFFHRHGPLQLAPDMPGARRTLAAPVPAYSVILGRVVHG